jgi:hypothetical protein
MTDKMTDLQEAIADVLADHFDSYNYDILYKYVAVDVLDELKYHELIALVLERDREIAELKKEIEKKAETIADVYRENMYYRKELGFSDWGSP